MSLHPPTSKTDSVDIEKALEAFSTTDAYWKMKSCAKRCIVNDGALNAEDIVDRIKRALREENLDTLARNFGFCWAQDIKVPYGAKSELKVYKEDDKVAPPEQSDGPFGEEKNLWSQVLCERLDRLRDIAGMPFIRKARRSEDVEKLRLDASGFTSVERIGENDSPFVSPRVSLITDFLFTGEDCYHAMIGLGKNKSKEPDIPINRLCLLPAKFVGDGECKKETSQSETRQSGAHIECPFSVMKHLIQVPYRQQLSDMLMEFDIQERHFGVDDLVSPGFKQYHTDKAREAAAHGGIPECWTLAKYGLPHALRPKMWATALGLDAITDMDRDHFESLCAQVEEQEMLTDLLVHHDIELLTSCHHFFPFEETLRSVLLAFTRDPSVSPNCQISPTRIITRRNGTCFPPSGVLPFKGLVMLAAPLCYVYEDPADVYRVFRAMYCRFWCRLTAFPVEGLPSPTLPGLCNIFENLMNEIDQEVHSHLHALGKPALQSAFPWVFSGFVGYLSGDQLLLLWDRVIARDSLIVLPILAAAVMTFRRKVILEAQSMEDLEEVIDDLSHIKVIPLLQAVLANATNPAAPC